MLDRNYRYPRAKRSAIIPRRWSRPDLVEAAARRGEWVTWKRRLYDLSKADGLRALAICLSPASVCMWLTGTAGRSGDSQQVVTMDYFDLGTNIQALVNTLYDENVAEQWVCETWKWALLWLC